MALFFGWKKEYEDNYDSIFRNESSNTEYKNESSNSEAENIISSFEDEHAKGLKQAIAKEYWDDALETERRNQYTFQPNVKIPVVLSPNEKPILDGQDIVQTTIDPNAEIEDACGNVISHGEFDYE